mmetsp:Transcript_29362/g.94716  ORF Transcript_29362/g.94716 Transcript_29362/m.94716 type:complete len:462 (-) Transcript_29362:610-1995(-)
MQLRRLGRRHFSSYCQGPRCIVLSHRERARRIGRIRLSRLRCLARLRALCVVARAQLLQLCSCRRLCFLSARGQSPALRLRLRQCGDRARLDLGQRLGGLNGLGQRSRLGGTRGVQVLPRLAKGAACHRLGSARILNVCLGHRSPRRLRLASGGSHRERLGCARLGRDQCLRRQLAGVASLARQSAGLFQPKAKLADGGSGSPLPGSRRLGLLLGGSGAVGLGLPTRLGRFDSRIRFLLHHPCADSMGRLRLRLCSSAVGLRGFVCGRNLSGSLLLSGRERLPCCARGLRLLGGSGRADGGQRDKLSLLAPPRRALECHVVAQSAERIASVAGRPRRRDPTSNSELRRLLGVASRPERLVERGCRGKRLLFGSGRFLLCLLQGRSRLRSLGCELRPNARQRGARAIQLQPRPIERRAYSEDLALRLELDGTYGLLRVEHPSGFRVGARLGVLAPGSLCGAT